MTGGWRGSWSDTWPGGRVTERAECVLAPNPGPMTLDGTNTWVLLEPGSDEALVVDPGPLDEAHLRAVLGAVRARGARVGLSVLTHHHLDHAASAARFAEISGSPVRRLAVGPGTAASRGRLPEGHARGGDLPEGRARDGDLRDGDLPEGDLRDGDRLDVGGLEAVVLATPGHTADSLSLLLPADQVLLTGDTMLGRGTTVVAYPGGDLTAYLASLERIAGFTAAGEVTQILPGHGPVVVDAAEAVRYYLDHRRERLQQVREALDAGDRTADEVVARVYADVPREVWPAARLSVLAQLAYLDRQGQG